jgi:hypothetical protein
MRELPEMFPPLEGFFDAPRYREAWAAAVLFVKR